MKICLLNDSFPPVIDGVANAICNYANVLSDDGHDVKVATPYYPDADDSIYPYPVIRYPSIEVNKKIVYRMGLPATPSQLETLKEGGIDIIHSHCPVTSTYLARMLREQTHAPIVLTYHTKFDIDIAKAIKGEFLQEKSIQALVENISSCDEIWTVSKGAGENLRSIGYQGEYFVMPNGVDIPKGKSSDEAVHALKKQYGIPEGLPAYLFVGRMMWYKGIRIILEALQKMQNDGYDYRMIFVGDGTDKKEIISETERLGLSEKIIFIEPIHDREEIQTYYSMADLFLFPSTFDTNGLVVREAAAESLPSVLIRGSCAAEDVTENQNGFLIDENKDALAKLLENLYGRKELLTHVGENASRDLYISWNEAIKKAQARYGEITENNAKGKYPSHEKPMDELIRYASKWLDDMEKAKKVLRQTEEQVNKVYLDKIAVIRKEAQTVENRLNDACMSTIEDIKERFDRFL